MNGADDMNVFPLLQLADSPDQPEGEASYCIKVGGIEVSAR